MKERPILFSGAMVRAVLSGAKTQTRRLLRWRPREEGINLQFSGLSLGCYNCDDPASGYVLRSRGAGSCWNDRTWPAHCPYGAPGDRLWVREAFAYSVKDPDSFHEPGEYSAETHDIVCRATSDNTGEWEHYEDGNRTRCAPPWRPGIHMPRWASRITLEITEVRVQRLQEIGGYDVLAEGVDNGKSNPTMGVRWQNMQRTAFEELWNSINGKRAPWSSNPWVWAVSFRRLP